MALLDEQLGDKYEVLEKVRVGGMGAIYKVRHRLLDEVRVVKVVRRPGAEGSDRFLREARAVIKLHHPNVAILHDFAVGTDGQAFIVMEFIAGWNLQEVLRSYGPPPIPLTIEIARQSLKALGYLHRHKIVHRDVSPDNLMLGRDEDGNPLVKLIDLGIAKTMEEEEGPAHLTAAGVFLGKPRYGSPERFNNGEWDERSDLYSFGVVLYELLTGCCPIAGSDSASLMAGHLFEPPRAFEETDPGGRVPAELRAIVLKSLAKKPEDRLASAEDFLWLLTILQDRFPLTSGSTEQFWRVFHSSVYADSSETPGSSVLTPLAIPLAMVQALAAARIASDPVEDAEGWKSPELPPPPKTRMTVLPAGVRFARAPAIPAAEPVRRQPRDTWASLTLHAPVTQTPAPLVPIPEPSPDPAPPAAKAPRHPFIWFAVAGFALGLIVVGVWLERFLGHLSSGPSPRPRVTAAATPPPVPPASTPARLAPAPSLPSLPAAPVAPATEIRESPPGKAEKSSVHPLTPALARTPPPPMEPGNMILRSFPRVQEPEVKQLPAYSYPAAAKGSGQRLSLRVSVLVDENGQVIDARIREGTPSGLGFEEAALDAAKKAQFFPATRDGIAGKMWTELLLEFAE